jgi:hypothetical protein
VLLTSSSVRDISPDRTSISFQEAESVFMEVKEPWASTAALARITPTSINVTIALAIARTRR